MAPFFRSISTNRRLSQHHHFQVTRNLGEISTINWVRDRALDHAVEKENNLKPIINIKDFIKSEPSKSVPISIIVKNMDTLQVPTRPIEFIRNYPSVFEQFLPGGIGVHPHIRLTPEVLNLDEEEKLMYQSETYRKQAADRLLKVLMLTRANKIPLCIVDRLKWDLGLPHDYVKSLLPEFPDYFHITNNDNGRIGSNNKRVLELVCWSNELAVSVMEKKAMKGEKGYTKGMPIAFPVEYSRGFEMDKKFKKWIDDWQKLPYVSPYENAFHLAPTSDESDKWSVSVLHELLHILVPKKTEKENVLTIGEYLGLRSRFKRAMLHHPGIFYVSSKNKTHTVMLREGYKRDLLIEKHVLMGMRSQYVHLMNTVKELPKSKAAPQGKTVDHKGEGEKEGDRKEKHEAVANGSSDSEIEDASNDQSDYDDEDDDDEEDSEDDSQIVTYPDNRGRKTNRTNLRVTRHSRIQGKENSVERYIPKSADRGPSNRSKQMEMNGVERIRGNSPRTRGQLSERSDSPRTRGQFSERSESPRCHGKFSDRSDSCRTRGKFSDRSDSPRTRVKFSERSDSPKTSGNFTERLDSPRTRGRSMPNKRKSAL